jgi:iron complex outermembrane receptor protein
VRAASVALLGRNLGLWTKYSGVDPEVNANAALGGETSYDYNSVPAPREWTLRINVGF